MKTSELTKNLFLWAEGIAKELGGRLDYIEGQKGGGISLRYVKKGELAGIHIPEEYLDEPLHYINEKEEERREEARERIRRTVERRKAETEKAEKLELKRLKKKYETAKS